MGAKKKEGDATKGQSVFNAQCASCHSLDSAGTGPALRGIYGSGIAQIGGFAYSSALLGKSKQKWTDANLDKWIQKPSGFAPGNKMGFAGVESKNDRLDLIAFLKASS